MPKPKDQAPTTTLTVAGFPRPVHTEVKVYAARRGLRLKEALAELVLAGLESVRSTSENGSATWFHGPLTQDPKDSF